MYDFSEKMGWATIKAFFTTDLDTLLARAKWQDG
jgi:hypothetical protein